MSASKAMSADALATVCVSEIDGPASTAPLTELNASVLPLRSSTVGSVKLAATSKSVS